MDKSALIPIAQGSEDMEAVIIIDILRRAGITVKVAGEHEIVTCSRGTRIIPDILLESLANDDLFDAVIIPGGKEGVENLSNNDRFIGNLKEHIRQGKIIGAICAAPIILSFHKLILPDTKITSHPSVSSLVKFGNYIEQALVSDGIFITSQGAGTAIPFALTLVGILGDLQLASKIAKDIVFSDFQIMNESIKAEFKVSGIVQGVGFRYYVWKHASGLDLKGYAQNLYDGGVSVVAEGSREQIEELYRLLKTGPTHSRVDRVSVTYKPFSGKYSVFEML